MNPFMLGAVVVSVGMALNVIWWKMSGSPVDHDREHDSIPVTVAGVIASFLTLIFMFLMFWWLAAQALDAWRGR